jgi:hypothetical protein
MATDVLRRAAAKARVGAVLGLAERGWRLLPCAARAKTPLLENWSALASSDPDVIRGWAQKHLDCNWGVATGMVSGLVVIDVDGEEGRASLAGLEKQNRVLPATLTVETGRPDGGEHLYYRLPPEVDVRNDQSGKIGPHIDIRGTGGYVVCPPSVHATGKHYRFVNLDAQIAELPGWVLERLAVRQRQGLQAVDGGGAVSKGGRTNRLVSLAGSMNKRGMSPEAIEAALLAENEVSCSPPLPKSKVRVIALDIPKRYPVGETTTPSAPAAPRMTPEEAAEPTANLLEVCCAWIRRYIIVSEEQALIMAAWILHTHAFDAAETTPYLHITAPERECGKSNLMETLEAIAYLPVSSRGMTTAALVRTIAAKQPTLFLDEMDTQLGGNKEYTEAVRGILNAGFRKGGVFHKCVGKEYELKEFNVYCPKCFAGIGQLPDTVASRSIVIEMRRKLPSETVEPLRQKAVRAAASPIKRELEAWSGRGAANLLYEIQPAPIASLGARQNDIVEPLLAIAQLAGDGWLQKLTRALETVFKAVVTEDGSMGATLLADIRSVFIAAAEDQMPSKLLAERLCEIEGGPWADWSYGKGMSANPLARQLRKFKIYPHNIRIVCEVVKGYTRADFDDAWERYCPRISVQTATTLHPASLLTETAIPKRYTPPTVADAKNASDPHKQQAVAAVADSNGEKLEAGISGDDEQLGEPDREKGEV